MNQSELREDNEEQSTALNALGRVCAHYGVNLDANQMRRSHPFEGAEPVPQLVATIAESAGFNARRVRIEPSDIKSLEKVLPALLFLTSGRVALLTKIQDNRGAPCALVEDPYPGAGPAILLDVPRLAQIWNGDVLLLKRRWKASDQDQPFDFKWLVGQVLLEKHLVRDMSLASLMMSILAIAPPFMFMVIIDRVMINHSMSTLVVLGFALIVMILFETAFGFIRRRLTAIAIARIDARINLHIYDRLLNLPLSFFERMSTGVIGAKINQVWFIRQFLIDTAAGILLDGFTLLVLVPILFYLSWQLTLFVIALAAIILGIYLLFLAPIGKQHSEVIRAEQKMHSQQIETIFGIKTVKSLSLDGLKRMQRDRLVADVVQERRTLEFLSNVPQTLVTPFERLIYVGSFFAGCYLALNQSAGGAANTVGSVLAFSMLAGRAAGPIIQIAAIVNSYDYARGAIAEVASVMNNPPEEGRSGTGLRRPIVGQVSFSEVKFKYSPTASYALNGVSFDLPAGTILGVMGRSGSGKTTVTRLLQGLNRDYEGIVKIDGMDLREIDLDHLRANIGVVPQENFLFRGTIAENISAARPYASFDLVARAAQMAGAEEFIERLPEGYSTYLEEGAVNLSGGQRQRLAIARALLVDPPILVLDEATSALDAESEAIVSANLMRIAKSRTVIIISHRLTSLIDANKILVLERGKLYDSGKHSELLERCDIYRSLWFQQNRHLDPEGRHARN